MKSNVNTNAEKILIVLTNQERELIKNPNGPTATLLTAIVVVFIIIALTNKTLQIILTFVLKIFFKILQKELKPTKEVKIKK